MSEIDLFLHFRIKGICTIGHGGGDCAPCSIGSYKDTIGAHDCTSCSNKSGFTTLQEGSESNEECEWAVVNSRTLQTVFKEITARYQTLPVVISDDVFFQVPVHLGMAGIIVTSAVRELSKRDLVLRNVLLVQMLWNILRQQQMVKGKPAPEIVC